MSEADSGCKDVAGLILAGGQARRMGGRHKAFLPLAGRPLVAHVAHRLRPQVACMAISANERITDLQPYAEAVLPDPVAGHAGPLAGVLAGLQWLRDTHPEARWLLSVAVDTPFFPSDLCPRLQRAAWQQGAQLAIASSGGRVHPVFALWSVDLTDALEQALREEGVRKILHFMQRFPLTQVTFDAEAADPFFNINTPADLQEAHALLHAPPSESKPDHQG